MSSPPESAAFPGSADRTRWSACVKTPSNPRRSGNDSLSSEDIDAQIRWFFENAIEGEPLRP